MKWITFLVGLMMLSATQVVGSEGSPFDAPEPEAGAPGPEIQEQRDWLREQLVLGLRSSRQIRRVQTHVDRMPPQHIELLTRIALAQRLPEDVVGVPRARWEARRALWLRRLLEEDLWWRRPAVGYLPVITWLPEGTSLGASAVVSPDGRHVRVSPWPMFSSVGPVYSYDLQTGETRRLPDPSGESASPGSSQTDSVGRQPHGFPQGGGYRAGDWPSHHQQPRSTPLGSPRGGGGYREGIFPQHHNPPRPQYEPPEVWHDGVRSRLGPRPGSDQ